MADKHDAKILNKILAHIGSKMSDIPRSNICTDLFPRAKDIKERIKKVDYIKFKSFGTAKENISKMKREPTV